MRTKFRVDQVYNGGQNVSMVPLATVRAVTTTEQVVENGKIADKTVEVSPEVKPPAENLAFFDSSHAEPGGEIRLLLIAPENAKEFTAGREFFVDFTPAS